MTIPVAKAPLLEGKKGLIVGIANDQSIAWGCAKAFRALGAEVAVTYLNEKAKKFVEPLAKELDAPIFMPLDVNTPGELEAVFQRSSKNGERWISLSTPLPSHPRKRCAVEWLIARATVLPSPWMCRAGHSCGWRTSRNR